eukprot:jgi/Ulvmu1/8257/UM041_0068.1
MRAWIDSIVPEGSEFSIDNLPWGVFTSRQREARICVAIGSHVVDIYEWAQSWQGNMGYGEEFGYQVKEALMERTLNKLLELGKVQWVSVRNALQTALRNHNPISQDTSAGIIRLIPLDSVTLILPIQIGNYTDFYCSKEHATNVGAMFRGKDHALSPNWLHMPIGYHGRASSIVVSGSTIRRPRGQVTTPEGPQFMPTKALDFELELACILGKSTQVGQSIALAEAEQHIFGYSLMNDCSARDIQKWEYVPLGPFNGKNFGTVLSPWIVQHEAVEPFLCDAPEQIPAPLPYLQDKDCCRRSFDLLMTVLIEPAGALQEFTACQAKFKDLYWTFPQMLTHHTAGGCNICAGDVIASGTISSTGVRAQGCLLELTQNGRNPLELGAWTRTWLEDGDTVVMRAVCDNGARRIGFGNCTVTIAPAN